VGARGRDSSYLSLGADGFHRVAYREWGDPGNPRVLLCVHGLTRNGRDFDELAAALADRYRVACPDVVGRGRSDWLRDPSGYAYPTYCADMAALIARLGAERIDWVGTSMGGIIGMLLAARPGNPIRRLVLNDVGPWIPRGALERIASYVGGDPRFPDRAALETFLARIYSPFGPFTEAQWSRLVDSSRREAPDGTIALAYDPAIAEPLRAMPAKDFDLWSAWDAVACPVLVVRGERSDVLTAETAREMALRGPGATVVEVPRVGHAPTLMDPEQIEQLARWLDS
jgi:pimeloyl-ACP methyl ester carboxylesterase